MPRPELADAPEAWVKVLHSDEAGSSLQASFEAELAAARDAQDHVVVVFTADWCSPCRTIKGWLEDSAPVRHAVQGGRFLFVDVDEWRGPAHALIEGANPSKLPMLVRVDYAGRLVRLATGSELGLLDDADAAGNLKRLLAGEAPVTPDYEADKERKVALLRAQAVRDQERAKGLEPVQIEVLERPAGAGGADGTWSLRLTLRTLESRMRWFVIPSVIGGALREKPAVPGHELHKFDEHVRYAWARYLSDPAFDIVAVGRNGRLVLEGWRIPGPADAATLEIWELNQLKIAGEVIQFDRKTPYELHIEDAGAQRVVRTGQEPLDVELVVRRRHEVSLR